VDEANSTKPSARPGAFLFAVLTRIYSFVAKRVIVNVYIVDYHTSQTPIGDIKQSNKGYIYE
jgi:hypothetical protein